MLTNNRSMDVKKISPKYGETQIDCVVYLIYYLELVGWFVIIGFFFCYCKRRLKLSSLLVCIDRSRYR